MFVIEVTPQSVLPPWRWADAVKMAGGVLARKRRGAAIWVKVPPVEETGRWWRQVLVSSVRFGGVPVPVAVQEDEPELGQFTWRPRLHLSAHPVGQMKEQSLEPYQERMLQVLGRISKGYTAEIASLSLTSPYAARRALQRLERWRYVLYHKGVMGEGAGGNGGDETEWRWPHWTLTRKGLSFVLRTWCVPRKGGRFRRWERKSRVSERHRRTSRLWNAWLRKAGYPVIWGWSEVKLPGVGKYAPDAFAWGRIDIDGEEILYWLEVEGGHKSGGEIARKTAERLRVAEAFARLYKAHLVFTVLGVPWGARAAARGMIKIAPTTAAIVGDWKAFGVLPSPRWGMVQVLV